MLRGRGRRISWLYSNDKVRKSHLRTHRVRTPELYVISRMGKSRTRKLSSHKVLVIWRKRERLLE